MSDDTVRGRRPAARLAAWLEERIGYSALLAMGRHKQVPIHRHTIWYYLGGMSAFLFAVQVATGILLLLYYRPSAEESFDSVQFIVTRVPFGWLIRSLHSWSANLLIFVLFVHMFSAYFLKAYRKPREITWLTGTALLFLMLAFGFSGYLLPWNTLAFFATQVGTEVAGAVPLVGPLALRLLRGGTQVTGGTLTRFYGFHVAILPALTTLVLGAHFALVQKHGMSIPPGAARQEKSGGGPASGTAAGAPSAGAPSAGGPSATRVGASMPFVPNFLLRDSIGWCAAVGVLAALAALFPWELGTKADPYAPAPAGIRPEWYFCWMFQMLKLLPAHLFGVEGELVGIALISAAGVLWILVPFIDRASPGSVWSRLFTIAGWLAVAAIAALTISAYVPGVPHGG